MWTLYSHASWLRIGLLLFMVGAIGCEHRAPTSAVLETVDDEGRQPDQESWDATFDVSEGGLPRLRVRAPYMARYALDDSTYTHLRTDPSRSDTTQQRAPEVIAYIFNTEGDSSATITAREMYYYDMSSRFEAKGNVVVISADGERLETEFLIWLEAEHLVRAPSFATLTTPTRRLQGYELVADENLENYEWKRLTGEFVIEDEE